MNNTNYSNYSQFSVHENFSVEFDNNNFDSTVSVKPNASGNPSTSGNGNSTNYSKNSQFSVQENVFVEFDKKNFDSTVSVKANAYGNTSTSGNGNITNYSKIAQFSAHSCNNVGMPNKFINHNVDYDKNTVYTVFSRPTTLGHHYSNIIFLSSNHEYNREYRPILS